MNRAVLGILVILMLSGCVGGPGAIHKASSSQKNAHAAARYNLELGLAYLEQGDQLRAKNKFLRAKRLAPDLPEAYYSMGLYLERVGEPKRAEAEYKKAIALNLHGAREHNNYGTFLCHQHRFEEAQREFLIALQDEEYPASYEIYENAGLCAFEKHDFKAAIAFFNQAQLHDPKRAITSQNYLKKLSAGES